MSNGKLKVAWDSFGNIKVPYTEEGTGEYEIIYMKFRGIKVPLIARTGSKFLYTTIQATNRATGLSVRGIQSDLERRPQAYTGLRRATCASKLVTFLQEHKKLFRIERMRQDLYLLSGEDLIMVGMRANSTRGDAFKKDCAAFILEHAEMTGIKKGDKKYAELEAEYAEVQQENKELRGMIERQNQLHTQQLERKDQQIQQQDQQLNHKDQQIAKWEETVESIMPYIETQSSSAGRALQAKKEINQIIN